jgi:uncharacterized protein YdhG (YjbR/CyaY superfamily)
VKSDAPTVDSYIVAHDGAKKDLLKQLRQAILEAAPAAVESMKYGMPTYRVGPDVFAFAVQKHYISVYVNQEDRISEHASRIGRHRRGKNCIRYARPEHVEVPGLKSLIRAAYGG